MPKTGGGTTDEKLRKRRAAASEMRRAAALALLIGEALSYIDKHGSLEGVADLRRQLKVAHLIVDPDIYQAARLLIDRHGAKAAAVASERADMRLEEGDLDAAVTWKRILAAIEELQRDRREDEAIN